MKHEEDIGRTANDTKGRKDAGGRDIDTGSFKDGESTCRVDDTWARHDVIVRDMEAI